MAWADIGLKQVRQRTLLTLEVWNKSEDSADVQSLNWVVYEVLPQKLQLITDQVVQKRRKTKIDGTPGFVNDPLTYHQVKPDKKTKKLRWYAGRHSGTF